VAGFSLISGEIMPNYYGTPAAFKTYWADRGNTVATSYDDTTQILPALLVASEWLDAAFLGRFGGLKVDGRSQVREWPRLGVQDIYGYAIDDASIPREVDAATYEAALRQILTPGIFFKDYTPGKYKNVTITGALSVEYATGNAYDFQTQMPQIAAILAPLLTGNANVSSLSGSVARM
jgi:hypothetical protein